MRLLILGGTQFVGRHIAGQALERGHDVTLVHRGRTNAELFPEARHVLVDRDARNAEMPEISGHDAIIDVSGYRPEQIRPIQTGHYVFISSVSAYDNPPPGFTEDAPLRTGTGYGADKAACERKIRDVYRDPLIIRPSYVFGPHDHLARFSWWADRIARGGEVLAPGPRADPIQYVDARDLATWMLDLTEERRPGTFHAASPEISFGDLLDTMAAVAGPPGTTLTWLEPQFLLDRGMGHDQLPLWPAADEDQAVNRADPAAALAAGLRLRPLADTVRDCVGDTYATPPERLTAAQEAELLTEAHR